jgi:hypothetical protein
MWEDDPKPDHIATKTPFSCINRRNASFRSAPASSLTAHREVGVRCEGLETSSQALFALCAALPTPGAVNGSVSAVYCAPAIGCGRVPLHCARAPLRGAHSVKTGARKMEIVVHNSTTDARIALRMLRAGNRDRRGEDKMQMDTNKSPHSCPFVPFVAEVFFDQLISVTTSPTLEPLALSRMPLNML